MANRSDPRFLNLQGFKAAKVVGVIGRKRADFHHGRSNELMLHREAGYMNATGFQNQSRYLAHGAGSIHEPLNLVARNA
jgi:hypothetical protein